MNADTLCPLCGKDSVSLRTDRVESEHLGSKALVDLLYSVCNTCTSDFADTEQSALNKQAVMAFRESASAANPR
jgi:HTH-type transcriptional regulator / antitoxin MqsA